MKPMSHYEFCRLFLLANIDPTNVFGQNHLVSAVQGQGIRKIDGSTPTTTVSERREIENKWKEWKRNLDMEKSIVTRNITPKKDLGMKANRWSCLV